MVEILVGAAGGVSWCDRWCARACVRTRARAEGGARLALLGAETRTTATTSPEALYLGRAQHQPGMSHGHWEQQRTGAARGAHLP